MWVRPTGRPTWAEWRHVVTSFWWPRAPGRRVALPGLSDVTWWRHSGGHVGPADGSLYLGWVTSCGDVILVATCTRPTGRSTWAEWRHVVTSFWWSRAPGRRVALPGLSDVMWWRHSKHWLVACRARHNPLDWSWITQLIAKPNHIIGYQHSYVHNSYCHVCHLYASGRRQMDMLNIIHNLELHIIYAILICSHPGKIYILNDNYLLMRLKDNFLTFWYNIIYMPKWTKSCYQAEHSLSIIHPVTRHVQCCRLVCHVTWADYWAGAAECRLLDTSVTRQQRNAFGTESLYCPHWQSFRIRHYASSAS